MRQLSESSGRRTSSARGRQFYRRVEYQPEGDHMQSSVPVVPFKNRVRDERLHKVKIVPNGVRVEDGELYIRMGKCEFLGVYLRRTQKKLERVLEEAKEL
jgi:hypothetical protein